MKYKMDDLSFQRKCTVSFDNMGMKLPGGKTVSAAPAAAPAQPSAAGGFGAWVGQQKAAGNTEPPPIEKENLDPFVLHNDSLLRYEGTEEAIVVPYHVTRIASGAFTRRSTLVTVVIPPNVTDILAYAFIGCERLRGVVLMGTNTRVEANAFSGCPVLQVQCHKDTATHRLLMQTYHGPVQFYEGEDTEPQSAVSTKNAACAKSLFIPRGTATITLKDGMVYQSPINCLLTRTWARFYEGIASDFNPKNPNLILYKDIKSIEIENFDENTYDLTYRITMHSGETHHLKMDSPIEYTFVSENTAVAVRKLLVKSIVFDPETDCATALDMLCIRIKDGDTVWAPTPMTFIGHKVRPEVVPSGHLSGWVSGNSWTASLETSRGQSIPLQSMKSLRFPAVKLESDELFDRWLTECRAEIEFRDGRKLNAQIAMDSLSFFVVDEFGPAEIKVEDIGEILFFERNEGKVQG